MSGVVVEIPPLTGAHAAAWAAILEIAERVPQHWSLVGGQMVLVHCWERGVSPARPTEDADAVIDVRARPTMLHAFTETLADLGFSSAGVSPSGHEHRWLRGAAQIDVLLPDGIGERAAGRTGISGSTTLETPGGTAALAHTERVDVRAGGTVVAVPRPHLAGAVLLKSRALLNPLDRHRGRHAVDVAVLAGMLGRADAVLLQDLLSAPKARKAVGRAVSVMQADRAPWVAVAGAEAGLARLESVLHR